MAESSSAQSSGGASSVDNPLAAFGANEWLVEEMYERYKQDPNSVDKAWWDFFKNYHGGDDGSGERPQHGPHHQPEELRSVCDGHRTSKY